MTATLEELNKVFASQRRHYLSNQVPSHKERIADLKQLKRLLIENKGPITDAINRDYLNRSSNETLFAELITTIDGINHAIKHLKGWMKKQKRQVDHAMFFGGKNTVVPQPIGVVGIIVPWNFPIFLSLGPLTSALSAGSTAMIKMSSNSSNLSSLLCNISGDYFPEDKVYFSKESSGLGATFTQLHFDLLIFTGSGATGRSVMSAAAKNLTPVILELGGKSPAIIDPNYPLDIAVDRIMYTKQFNAGQICTTVDYVFVHTSQKDLFIRKAIDWVNTHVPEIASSDYTSIIDDRSLRRLESTIQDATDKGALVINLNKGQSIDYTNRKMPLYIITDTTSEMTVSNQETFGPILMVLTYNNDREVIEYINSRDKPLAIYPFSNSKKLINNYTANIISGGVPVNNVLLHVIQHDLPFGGIGASGMGHYHGKDGFQSCSKMRPIFYQPKFSFVNRFLSPPYGKFATGFINRLFYLKS
jgi:coniferyl-aldehyde dehydrogenase